MVTGEPVPAAIHALFITCICAEAAEAADPKRRGEGLKKHWVQYFVKKVKYVQRLLVDRAPEAGEDAPEFMWRCMCGDISEGKSKHTEYLSRSPHRKVSIDHFANQHK